MIRIQMWKEKIRWDDSLEAFAGGGEGLLIFHFCISILFLAVWWQLDPLF